MPCHIHNTPFPASSGVPAQAPPPPTLAECIEVLRVSADLSLSFEDFFALGRKFDRLGPRLFGVQADELPPELRDSPVAFAEWTRRRRSAALAAAEALEQGTSKMRNREVRFGGGGGGGGRVRVCS